MARNSPQRVAMREGIGARLLELGFTRRTERFYVREDTEYREWVRFELSSWRAFVDRAGFVHKGLEAAIAALDLDVERSLSDLRDMAHLRHGAHWAWARQSDASKAAYHKARRRYGWLVWQFWASDRHWSSTDPFEQSAFTGRDGWQCADDPVGCAAESAARWQ